MIDPNPYFAAPVRDPASPADIALLDQGSRRGKSSSLTVIICTRDRCAALARSLVSVERAIAGIAEDQVEVIIVDDGSRDATTSVMTDWFERTKSKGLALTRQRSGLAASRNAALRYAVNDVVVMIDDDCHMAPDYLQQVVALITDDRVDTIRGGRILLGSPEDLAITIKTSTESATLVPGMRPGGFIMGANLVFPRRLLNRIGYFDERFGAGGRYLSAEDTDFFYRASLCGLPVIYEPLLIVEHFHGRRYDHERKQLFHGYAIGNGAFYAKHLFRNADAARQMYFQLRNVLQRLPHLREERADFMINITELVGNLTGMTKFAVDHLLKRA